MNYYKQAKKRSQNTSPTKILLKFYNEITGENLDNWDQVPADRMKTLMELGFEPVAKIYAKRLLEEGKSVYHISSVTGLSVRKVSLLRG